MKGCNLMCRIRPRTASAVLLLLALFLTYVPATPALQQQRVGRGGLTGWASVPVILKRIKPPKFPARDFRITDYGARAGTETDSTEAIRKAIEACNKAGGGRVVVPVGVF